MDIPGLVLRSYCDALSASARQIVSLAPAVALRNVLFLVLQMLYITFPGCAGQDGRLSSGDWSLRDGLPLSGTWEPSVVAYDYRLNLIEHRLLITWMISGCRERELAMHQQEALVASTGCLPDRAIAVYLNNASERAFSYDPDRVMSGPLWIPKFNSFKTEHELRTLQHSPHSYTFGTFVFIVDLTTNLSVNIDRFAVTDSLNGFTMSSQTRSVTKQFVYDTGNGRETAEIEARAVEIEIRRSKLAHTLTMCMFATNWALTIASTYAAFEAMTKVRVTFAAVIAHGSMGLAIMAISKLYLGPPPFGAFLDTVGFVSQIATVAVCNMALLCSFAKQHWSSELSPHHLLENPLEKD